MPRISQFFVWLDFRTLNLWPLRAPGYGPLTRESGDLMLQPLFLRIRLTWWSE